MPTFKITGHSGLSAVRQYIDRIPDDQKRREVTIKLQRERRTIPQNSLYHMWLRIIADETGNNVDDTHEAMKTMFLGEKEVRLGGYDVIATCSTASLDTCQFTRFLNQMEAWVSAELGIVLPRPEDRFFVDFYEKYGAL